MEPITTITTAISSLKTAIEIAQLLKSTERTFTDVESKLKLAEIINALADAKLSIAEFKDIILQKEEEIKVLKMSLAIKENVTYNDREGIYLSRNEDGNISGKYCSRCYDVDHNLVRLNERENGYHCGQCRSYYPNERYKD